jgi:TRAP-type C4-dicarboxylate transport system substrate-binding protein
MLTQHLQQSQLVSMSREFWQGLSQRQRDVIQNAVDVAGDYVAELNQKLDVDNIARLKQVQGTQVVTDIDKPAFIARARQLDPELKSAWGPLYDQILTEQEKM